MAASGEMVVMPPKEREGVMVPMGVCPGMWIGKRSYSLGRPSNFFMGVIGNESKPMSGSCLTE